MKIQTLFLSALLMGCSTFMKSRHTARLTVGAQAEKMFSEARRVLGPAKDKMEIYSQDKDAVQVVGFPYERDTDLLLYFYRGQFIQVAPVRVGEEVPPIRPDFRNIDNRAIGPDVFEITKRGRVYVTPLTDKRARK